METKLPSLKVLLVFNLDPESKSEKSTALQSYFPATSCSLDVTPLYTRNIDTVVENIQKIEPHIVVHYGYGNGCFWETDEFCGVSTITDDHSVLELFYLDGGYIYTTLFDKIKKAILEIDKQLSMPSKIKIARTKADLEYIKNRCMLEPFGFDTETNFLNPFLRTPEPKLLCYSVAWLSDEEEGWCVPTSQKHIDELHAEFSIEETLEVAEEIFFSSPQSMYIHNAMYDLLVLWELFGGRQPKNFAADTMLLLNLYHMASKSVSLENNVALVGLPQYKNIAKNYLLQTSGKKALKGFSGFDSVPVEVIGPYAAMDAIAVVRLVNLLLPALGRDALTFYYNIPHQVLLTSLELCISGYQISRDRFTFTKLSVEEAITETYKVAMSLVSGNVSAGFNIASSQQLSELLFTKLKLPVTAKTSKGKDATNAKVLDDLILFHPFIFYLNKLKKLQKLYSSYVKGYYNVLGSGSRILKKTNSWTFNSQYRQTNRTARLSASNLCGYARTDKTGGNILTLPATGSMVKHYFIPEPIVEIENELYEEILLELKNQDEEKYTKVMAEINKDISNITKPTVPKALKIKVPSAKKKNKKLEPVMDPENDCNLSE